MNLTNIITTEEAREGFFPTPPDVAEKLLEDIDWTLVKSILEPSAGKGDLVKAAIKARYDATGRYRDTGFEIDCIEIDPYLRQILKFNASDEVVEDLRKRRIALHSISYSSMTKEEHRELDEIEAMLEMHQSASVRVVHDDFLTFRTEKQYSLILMNPPFADGDRHLLKALEMQKHGGRIACILNAETLRNPYTNIRKLLLRELERLDAEIEYIDNGFSSAERRTDVSVAIIKVHIPAVSYHSTIYERMEEAVKAEEAAAPEQRAIVFGDYIDRQITHYRTEVAATMEFIREYRALCPLMTRSFKDGGVGSDPILTLVVERDSDYSGLNVDKYMRLVRLKYWKSLFDNPEFTKNMTSELRDRYHSDVEQLANYEFSRFNIAQLIIEINANLVDGIQKAIMDLFEKLTFTHSWYPEYEVNKHYFSGWRTNEAHKIGKKSIIPTHGMFSDYSWTKETFNVSTAYKVISDIEKVFDYLNGGAENDGYSLEERLKEAEAAGRTRNIECKYFKIDIFKKGTTHIKYTDLDMVEKLNIYAAQNKNWLPPNYGKATYKDMSKEERTVVDGFHGDGTEGSGEAAYIDVLARKDYYLSDSTRNMPALMAGA